MNKVKDAIAEMYQVMEGLQMYGASDTEPRAEFAEIMFDALKGKEPVIPATAQGWRLYSDMDGSDGAARMLSDKVRSVLNIANSDHRGFVKAMEYYFGRYR